MPEDTDGTRDTPEGRKVFVRRREDETAEEFAERAMRLLVESGQIRAEDV